MYKKVFGNGFKNRDRSMKNANLLLACGIGRELLLHFFAKDAKFMDRFSRLNPKAAAKLINDKMNALFSQ